MKKVLLSILTVLVLMMSVVQPLQACAVEPVDLSRKCSLTLEYSKDGIGFSDLQIQIFRVGKMEANGNIDLVGPFARFPVKIHGITSQKEWRDTANTLAFYTSADNLEPYASALTDTDGRVSFAGLETGVYLVMGTSAVTQTGTYRFENFCQFLPISIDGQNQNYDVVAKPKSTFEPKPEEPKREFQVIKLWKDAGNRGKRPKSVSIDILKNGVVQETVQLNPDNNWSYSWTAPVGEDIWSVVERDVPADYTVVISTSATGFAITNTCKIPGGDTPQTGDLFVLRPWITAMCVSGMLLMVLGLLPKRKRG